MIDSPQVRAAIAALDKKFHEQPSNLELIAARRALMDLDLTASQHVAAEHHGEAAKVLMAAATLLTAFADGRDANAAPLRKLLDARRVPHAMRAHVLAALVLAEHRHMFVEKHFDR